MVHQNDEMPHCSALSAPADRGDRTAKLILPSDGFRYEMVSSSAKYAKAYPLGSTRALKNVF